MHQPVLETVPPARRAADSAAAALAYGIAVLALVGGYAGGYPLAYLLMVLTILATVLTAATRPRFWQGIDLTAALMAAGWLLIALAFAATADGWPDLAFAANYLMFLLYWPLSALMARAARPANTVILAWAALAGSAVAALIASVQVFGFGLPRAQGFGSDPIWSAQAAVIIGFLALIGLPAAAGRRRWLFLFGPLAGIYVALLSGSRGPLLAAAVLAVFALALLARDWRKAAAVLAAAVVAGLALVLLVDSGPVSRIAEGWQAALQALTGADIAEWSSSVRVDIYAAALAAIGEAPLFGHGYADRIDAVAAHMSDGGAMFRDPDNYMLGTQHLHSDLLDIGVAAGTVGLLGYLLALAAPLIGAWKSAPDAQRPARRLGAGILSLGYLAGGLTYAMIGYEYHTALYVCLSAAVLGLCRAPTNR